MAIQQSEIEKLETMCNSAQRLYALGEREMAFIGVKQILENITFLACEQEGIDIRVKNIQMLFKQFMLNIVEKYPYFKMDIDDVYRKFNILFSEGNRAAHGMTIENNYIQIEFKNYLQLILSLFKEYVKFTLLPLSREIYIEDKSKAFTHCLQYLHIENYQCIKNLEINDIPADAQFIVFSGENGFGKTALLQAIAIGLNGNISDKEILCNDPKTRIKVEVKTKIAFYFLESEEREIPQIIINEFLGYGKSHLDSIINIKNLAAYGASRLQLESQESTQKEFSRSSPVYNLFHDDGVLRNIEYKFDLVGQFGYSNLKNKKITSNFLGEVTDILKKILPHIQDIQVRGKARERRLIFWENEQQIITNNLSAGNKSIFGMVGDLILRLRDSNEDKENISDYEGIVLIDELEAHLHPKWQREFPRLLAEIFPKVQFIVTTHSAITFLGMPSNSVFYNVTSHPEKGTQAERIDIDIENLLPNQILTSPIFGMENIKHVHNQNGDKVRTEENYAETLKREEVRNALKEAAKNFSFPPLKD